MFTVKPLDRGAADHIQQRIDQKTKPPGSLGSLESLAVQLALITGSESIEIQQPTMLVFAADHGIASEGISIAPSEVTQQMVLNFVRGGAAINCFCRLNQLDLKVIDCGMINPVDDAQVIDQRLGNGTANFATQPAMSAKVVQEGFAHARRLLQQLADNGCNLIGLGDMGIGNTSAAAAVMAALTGLPASACVGRGTGVSDEALAKKLELIEQSLQLHREQFSDPVSILAAVGGFEIVQMTGAMLAAAERRMVVLVDGFIATAAAMLANRIAPAAKDYMVFCHQSGEQGHRTMLEHLEAHPLLDLGMRLGEGTGAALAMNLVNAAAIFYNEMATFASAGVDEV